jgi:hypothetical protein
MVFMTPELVSCKGSQYLARRPRASLILHKPNMNKLFISFLIFFAGVASSFGAMNQLQVMQAFPPSVIARLFNANAATITSTGLVGANSPTWQSPEEQNGGSNYLLFGVITNNPSMIAEGFTSIDATLGHQLPNGGIASSSGSAVSTDNSFWMQATAQALLVLRESQWWPQYQARTEAYYPAFEKVLQYLNANTASLYSNSANTPNRLFIAANSLYLGSKLVGQAIGLDNASILKNDGLKMFDSSKGYFLELSGYDSSYQCVSLNQLFQYNYYYPGSNQVISVLNAGEAWEATRIEANGTVNASGNTRTNGQETDPNGEVKRIDIRGVVSMFSTFGVVFNNSAATNLSLLILPHV